MLAGLVSSVASLLGFWISTFCVFNGLPPVCLYSNILFLYRDQAYWIITLVYTQSPHSRPSFQILEAETFTHKFWRIPFSPQYYTQDISLLQDILHHNIINLHPHKEVNYIESMQKKGLYIRIF